MINIYRLTLKNGVMFRPEFNGFSYFIHMNIQREGGYEERKYVGGPFIRKDIAEAFKVDPRTIKATDQVYELAKRSKTVISKIKMEKRLPPSDLDIGVIANTEWTPVQ